MGKYVAGSTIRRYSLGILNVCSDLVICVGAVIAGMGFA